MMNKLKMHSLTLIQSRLSSSRLPGKALLPIAGLPLIVLVAKRAANKGRAVQVLTSNDYSDDSICEVLDEHNIAYFRGSLCNVLKRFHDALVEYTDDTKVFRLTGDNVLPDGHFLDEMEAAFDSDCADIMLSDSHEIGMPIGVSAELTTVGWIREAFQNSNDPYDIEHVTPYIHRKGISKCFASSLVKRYRNLRCGIDIFDDYLSVRSLFDGQLNPVTASINSLINNFNNMKYHPYYDSIPKPMTLGGVQFGLDYGLTNTIGKVSESEAIQIIRHAITEGVEYIDTAAAYGDSEKVIGAALQSGWSDRVKIITKLLPIDDRFLAQSEDSCLSLMVRNSFLQSCVNFNAERIHTLMLHRAQHLKNNIIFDELKKIKTEGLIQNIGISVQSPDELNFVLDNEDISIIQMPYNILDNRWDSMIEKIKKIREERGIIIHARSALLQGLLCSSDESKWNAVGIENSRKIVSWLTSKFKQYKKKSISDLCIGYVNSQDWIDSVVIGVDTKSNLFSNLQSISMPLMPADVLNDLASSRPIINSESLNPSSWSIHV
jgi:aryl-alcohol dehydrogenase-like predicted oxidoreductase/spore coat polysaccharide biosynthesis protein SpsF (cytidylyltransferase family)